MGCPMPLQSNRMSQAFLTPQSSPPGEPPPPSSTETSQASFGDAGTALGLKAALRLLFPLPRRRPVKAAGGIGLAFHWVVPIGLLVGFAWVGVFKGAWRIYGEAGNMRVIPALAVVLLEATLTGPLLILGLARTVGLLTGPRSLRPESTDPLTPLSPVGTLALCLILLGQWVLIVSVPIATGWWPSPDDWRYPLRHMYPAPLYRPLLLAPLWGRWGILLAATIGRCASHADAETRQFCEAMLPGRLLAHSLLPFTLTSVYLSRDGNLLIGVVLGLILFALTYLSGVLMARRGGGQTRQTIFASGQIAQLAFLALYRAFWPLIHG